MSYSGKIKAAREEAGRISMRETMGKVARDALIKWQSGHGSDFLINAWNEIGDDLREMYSSMGEAVFNKTLELLASKEIPQNVIRIPGKSSQACPVCENDVNWKYCPNCGQKLHYGFFKEELGD